MFTKIKMLFKIWLIRYFAENDAPVERVAGYRLMRLSDSRINVSDARVKTAIGKPACIDLKIELSSAKQLQITMSQIKSMADVIDIARIGLN